MTRRESKTEIELSRCMKSGVLAKLIVCLLATFCINFLSACSGCSSDSEDTEKAPNEDSTVINTESDVSDDSENVYEAKRKGYDKGYEEGKEDALNHNDKDYNYDGCDDYSGEEYDAYRSAFEEGYDEGYNDGLKVLNEEKQQQMRQNQIEYEREQQRIANDQERFHQDEIRNAYNNGFLSGRLIGQLDARNGESYGSNLSYGYDSSDPDEIRAHNRGLKEGYYAGYYGY